MNFTQGEVIAVDKPYTWSSFGVVAKLRWCLSQRMGRKVKVGHAGTLDPLATGVLLLCTGRATKRIEELQKEDKEYVAELFLGATTASFDKEHPIDATYPSEHITRELIDRTILRFLGDIDQVPPTYSACKVDGKRAYDYTRKGRDVTLCSKPVHIYEIEVEHFAFPMLRIRVRCGKGTYIRALARDLGQALGSGAYLTSLRRIRVGQYSVRDCIPFEQLQAWAETVPIDDAPLSE